MAITTDQISQLSINKLKGCYFNEGTVGGGNFQNSNLDPALYLESDFTTSNRVLRVQYKILDGSKFMNYEIKICTVPSNLGKSLTYYFLCPVTKRRAKILYLCYRTNLFVHRDIYPQRLYYSTQLSNKYDRIHARLDMNDKKLFEHFFRIKKQNYQGKNTRLKNAINQLIEKRRTLDLLCAKHLEANFQYFASRLL